mmetsp:Transcript_34946/g.76638  ORF Transcript_34946/g.76638 Transcript_34946/m.76638 type:complete len:247 (-) Transcript_34946:14-754(-)
MAEFSKDGIVLTRSPSSGIYTLCIDRTENVFNPTLVSAVSSAITHVENASHPKALIVTSGGKKFFSNGLDLTYMMSHGGDGTAKLIESVWRLLARILVLDCRTVAAINGHAFGAGLFLALSCDYRLMRTERGYLCWPELNLGMRLAKGFAELSRAKILPATLREGVLTGRRYGSTDAIRAGIVDEECEVGELMVRAEEIAEAGLPDNLNAANFDAASFRQMKIELYTDAYRALSMGSVDAEPESRL